MQHHDKPPEPTWPPPPDPEPCLVRAYSSRSVQKGGTVIAESVHDPATHARRLCTPDGYRPPACPRCQHDVLHVHDYRERLLRAEPSDETGSAHVVDVVRYQCAHDECGATWLVLPAFVTRHLWRSWPVVERNTVGAPPRAKDPPVPPRTVQRWRGRLVAAALLLAQLLATSGGAVLEAVARTTGLRATREQFVQLFAAMTGAVPGRRLADLAALAHRLRPGVRLM